MKDKPNEWVSISDLMSGVMAVVMLLLVMAILQKTVAESQGEEAQKKKIKTMMTELQATVQQQGASDLIDFNASESRITLKDNIFQKGSACITPLAAQALMSIESKVSEYLKKNDNATILVEGHTDNIPVSSPVTNYQIFCTVYDDNFTLSAARAREARKLLIQNITTQEAKRVIVAGYGDSKPIQGLNGSDPQNRRVEIRFITTK